MAVSRRTNSSSRPGDGASLHGAVTRWTFGAVLLGMAAYSLVEFTLERPDDWQMFLLHHVMHVALIGVAVWIASMMVIRRFVIEPVDHVFVHLRRIAAGRLEFLHCTVRARELGEVVASLNDLVSRLRRTPEPDALSHALDHLRNLRAELRISSKKKLGDDIVPVMRLVTSLEESLLEFLQIAGNGSDHLGEARYSQKASDDPFDHV